MKKLLIILLSFIPVIVFIYLVYPKPLSKYPYAFSPVKKGVWNTVMDIPNCKENRGPWCNLECYDVFDYRYHLCKFRGERFKSNFYDHQLYVLCPLEGNSFTATCKPIAIN